MNSKHTTMNRSICIYLLIPVTLLVFAACGPRYRPAPSDKPVAIPTKMAQFASDTECAECHGGIAKSHQASRHATSLHFARASVLKDLSPPPGPIHGTRYSVARRGDTFVFQNANSPVKERTLDLAFGSGKIGITYVALTGDQTLEEMRMSYVPKLKRWYITPGQEDLWDDDLGYPHDASSARPCVVCHTSTLPTTTLKPEPQHLGIGCQACHGPAALHVAAARAGKTDDLGIERASQWSADRLNQVCGKCHRSQDRVGTTGNEINMTHRFQAYGLEQSPCFQKSAGKLTCVSCHNPHANVSTERRSYEAVCLKCHAGATSASNNHLAVKRKQCPVNPVEKCIGCHMPRRQVFPRSGISVPMADHLIWAYRDRKSQE